jgi:hypothetical protein
VQKLLLTSLALTVLTTLACATAPVKKQNDVSVSFNNVGMSKDKLYICGFPRSMAILDCIDYERFAKSIRDGQQ